MKRSTRIYVAPGRTLPTYSVDPRFSRDLGHLSSTQLHAFVRAKNRLVAALKAGRMLDTGLGVHQMTGHPGVYEFRYSHRGRATFAYGTRHRCPRDLAAHRRP